MTQTMWSLVWLSVVLAVAGWWWLSLALAAGLFAWTLRWVGCEGRHSIQSSQIWRRGRWHQTRWRCVRCGERFEWASRELG